MRLGAVVHYSFNVVLLVTSESVDSVPLEGYSMFGACC